MATYKFTDEEMDRLLKQFIWACDWKRLPPPPEEVVNFYGEELKRQTALRLNNPDIEWLQMKKSEFEWFVVISATSITLDTYCLDGQWIKP